MIHHPSYDNVLEKCFSPFARPHILYFMFHALYAFLDFIKSNQEKFISFYRYAIEHDSNKTLFLGRKASDGGDKNI